MEIISSNRSFIAALERFLSTALKVDYERLSNLTFIDVSTVFNLEQVMTARTGFSLVKEIADNPKRIAILISKEKEKDLMEHNEYFRVLMAYPNVGFVNALKLKRIPRVYFKLADGRKKKDEETIALFEERQKERAIATLRYTMVYALVEGNYCQDWLTQANSLGFEGDQGQIVKKVKRWLPRIDGFLQNKFFEGIFVDAYGTLFDSNWQLNVAVKTAVEELAERLEKKVFIISDSEKWLIERKKSENDITWESLSKYDLKGTILETVVDNLKEKDFLSQHDIYAFRYITVNEIASAVSKITSLT